MYTKKRDFKRWCLKRRRPFSTVDIEKYARKYKYVLASTFTRYAHLFCQQYINDTPNMDWELERLSKEEVIKRGLDSKLAWFKVWGARY